MVVGKRVLARYQMRARVLKALAHPTRLLIVDRLAQGACSVGELAEHTGAKFPVVSRHLALLKEVGIVESRREGMHIFYFLKTPCVLNFFNCVEAVLRATARARKELIG